MDMQVLDDAKRLDVARVAVAFEQVLFRDEHALETHLGMRDALSIGLG